jgi:hypothetical protein
MQVTGMRYGAKLLKFVDFPATEALGPDAGEEQIEAFLRTETRSIGDTLARLGLAQAREVE